MKYYYKVYGLTVESEVTCEELVVWDKAENEVSDVIIEFGTPTEEVQQQLELGEVCRYESQLMWFKVPRIATYCIIQGKRILIDKELDATLLDVKQFLLGSCLGMIMLQRDMIAIHGGTIAMNGKGLLITGNRGAGKSTLTSALRLKGYPLVADDVSAMKSLMVQPAYPQQKVCEDMMNYLGYHSTNYKHINLDQKTKYLIPTRDQFSYNPVPLKGIIELVSDEMIDRIEVEQLKGYDKLMTIYNNIYRIEMKICAGINPTFFKQCVQLTSEIPVYRMKRPTGKWTVDHQIKWIEQQFLDEEKLYKTQ